MKGSINPALAIIAIILGVSTCKKFNFETFTFEKPALNILYLVTCLACVFLIIKDMRNKK
ncbi:MAG: hypothetical protein RL757_16 [Bacteroidota bacterium]